MNTKKILCGLSALLILAGCSSNKTSENIKVERFDDKIVINIEGKGEYEYIYSDADNENLITVIKETSDDKLKVEISEDGTVSLTAKDIPNGASLILNEVNDAKEENGLVGKWELMQKISNPDVELEDYLIEASVETTDKLPIETIIEIAKKMEPYQRGKETLVFYEDGKLDVWQEGFNGFSGTYSIDEDGLRHNIMAPDVYTTGSKFLVNDEYLVLFIDSSRCEVYQRAN